MEKIREVVTLQKNGGVILPSPILRKERLKEGDYLDVIDMEGIIIIRKMVTKPDSEDIFAQFSRALREKGYDTREKLQGLIDEVKMEVTEEWLKKNE